MRNRSNEIDQIKDKPIYVLRGINHGKNPWVKSPLHVQRTNLLNAIMKGLCR